MLHFLSLLLFGNRVVSVTHRPLYLSEKLANGMGFTWLITSGGVGQNRPRASGTFRSNQIRKKGRLVL